MSLRYYGGGFVGDHNELRRFLATSRDCKQRAHTEALHFVFAEYFAFEAFTFGHLPRFAGERCRGHHIARFKPETAREVCSFAETPAGFDRAIEIHAVRRLADQTKFLNLTLRFIVGFVQAAVHLAEHCAFDDRLRASGIG